VDEPRFAPQRAVFYARRGWVPLALTAVVGLLTLWIGLEVASVPTGRLDGSTRVPVWRLLAMVVGIGPALGMHSRLADLEETGTARHRRAERRHLLDLFLACSGIYLALAALTLSPDLLGIIVRALPGWLGVALVSGRLLGWRLAWVLPSVVLCVLMYWGIEPDGAYAWWEFSARPYDDPRTLLLSAGLLGAGILAFCVTPWRWRRVTARSG
jgi:hypothetical protein